jgi:adenylate cyclase
LAVHAEDLGEYRLKGFEQPQRVYHLRGEGESGEQGNAGRSVLVDPDFSTRPSIAVLPFDNLSGYSDQLYFADGLTEELMAQTPHRTRFVAGRSRA